MAQAAHPSVRAEVDDLGGCDGWLTLVMPRPGPVAGSGRVRLIGPWSVYVVRWAMQHWTKSWMTGLSLSAGAQATPT